MYLKRVRADQLSMFITYSICFHISPGRCSNLQSMPFSVANRKVVMNMPVAANNHRSTEITEETERS